MDVSQAILTKRAVRQFKEQALKQEEIEAILKAGRRAQSSKNTQPWRFIAIKDRATLQALSDLGNFGSHMAGAAMGVAILTVDPDQRFSIMFDAGQAAAYMQLAAWELGIGSCLMTVYQHEEARQLLGFPDDWHLRIGISFGYPLDEDTLTRPPTGKGRVAFDEVVHWDKW